MSVYFFQQLKNHFPGFYEVMWTLLKLLMTILVKIDTEVTLIPSIGSNRANTPITALCIHFLTCYKFEHRTYIINLINT